MKTRFNKLTAWLLTLAMLMTFMSSFTFTVLAADGNVASVTTADGKTTTTHTDITSAINTAMQNSGSTLKLLDNITTGTIVDIDNGSFTIDLNGKTWSFFSIYGRLGIIDTANIKLTDSSADGTGKLVGDTFGVSTIIICGSSKLEIAGGTVENVKTFPIEMSDVGSTSNAELIVSGGKVTTNDSTAINAFGRSVKITGGTIESTRCDISYKNGVIDLSGHSNPAGITIANDTDAAFTLGDTTIKLPEGYAMLNGSGTAVGRCHPNVVYTVGKAPEPTPGSIASVATAYEAIASYYTDITSAINAAIADNGSTLKLLDNITTDSTVAIDRGSFTIDLGGKTWTAQSVLISGDATNITIADSSTDGKGMLVGNYENSLVRLDGSAKLVIQGGTFNSIGETIDYSGGVIDLSEHNDPTGITISAQSTILVDGNILLPTGYFMLDEDGNTMTSLEVNEIYTVGECNHLGENNGFCVCGFKQPAVLNGDTYEISNAGQLFWFANEVNSGKSDINGKLTANIDLENRAWTTICETGLYYNGYGTDYGYSGTFDGNNHIIKNITVKSSETKDASCGLFGTVSGTIKRLGIEGFTFVDGGKDIRAGAIVGQLITANGKVSDCYVKGATIDPKEHVAGGIAGCVYEGTIENCYVVESTISGTSGRFGHIVGDSRGDKSESDRKGTVTNCYSDNEFLLSDRVGKVTKCETKSKEAFANGEVAHLLGEAWGQDLSDANSLPTLGGKKIDCEYNNGFCTHGCYQAATDSDKDGYYEIGNAGQLFWFANQVNSGDTDANAKLVADIDLFEYGNLMIGTSTAKYSGSFDGNGKKLTVNFDITEEYAAPFRYINGATIQNLTVDGTIATSAKFAAGLVGYSDGTGKIEKCMVGVTINSSVNGDGTHGGLVANVGSGTLTIDNCGFIGSIVGNDTHSCGGFVGWANGKVTIKNSYICGTFTTGTTSCNTFGRNAGNIEISNSYYKTTYGTDNSGATQKSAEQFASGDVAHSLGGAWGQDLSDATSLPTLGGKKVDCDYNNGFCIYGCYQPATYSEKDGYYEIGNAGQFFWFANEVNGGKSDINGKLTADIDLENKAWTPIANFSGTFDGAGKEIKNFAMNINGAGNYGLFGFVKDATIKNFTISGEVESTLTARPNDFKYGVIADAAGDTIITDIHSYVNLTIKDDKYRHFVGGIVGRNNESGENLAIERCSFGGTLNLGEAQVDCTGGIIAYVYTYNTVKLNNCLFNGEIISQYDSAMQIGGLMGYYKGTELTITNALSIGDINISNKNKVGSLVGILRDHSSANEKVKNNYYLGHQPFGNSGDKSEITNSYSGQKVELSATAVIEEQLKSGEVTYLLNRGVTDGTQAFYQTVGEGAPTFEGKTVYYGYEDCSSKKKTYSNTELFKVRPDHKDDTSDDICDICTIEIHKCDYTDNNGFCINCGGFEPAVYSGDTYEISNAGQFFCFAQMVNDEGDTRANAKLVADIDLSKYGNVMIGTSTAKYSGSFDGNGKKLTVNFDITEEFAAPFRYINGAIIQNLTVDGTIATSAKFAAGLVGYSDGAGKIEKCMVGVTINSSVNGDGTHGGLVANVNSGSMTIDNCGFIGSIVGNDTHSCGGFVGWTNGKVTIKNSYICGTFTTGTTSCNTFGRNAGNIEISNSYYKTTYGTDNSGATQKSAEQFASGEVAYLLGEAWGQRIGKDDYPVLGGKKVQFANEVYYNEIKEFEILSTGTDGAKATAAVTIPTVGTYTLIFADYEGTRLNKVDTVTFTVTEDKVGAMRVPSEIDITLDTGDKIMLWQDMVKLVPLCEAYIVE